MIPRVGKVEKVCSPRGSKDTPYNHNDQQSQSSKDFMSLYKDEYEKRESSEQVEDPPKKLVLRRSSVEISPEAQRLYEESKRNSK